jgi:AcrR family transcriptional regulator
MQRRRLLSATVELAYEHGVQAISVATLCERAGLSRRTFYECFDGREACLLATFEDALARATRVVREAAVGAQSWREQARSGLTSLLSFLDGEPGVGCLLVVEALGAGHDTLEARRRGIAQIIAFVDRGRLEAKASRQPPPLTAEGIVGAVFSVIHARMLARPREGERPREDQRRRSRDTGGQPGGRGRAEDLSPLVELTGPLMAMIVQPYLGPAAARRELERPVPVSTRPAAPRLPADPFKDLPMRLTYRTVRVLSSIAEEPGASSKHVADASGITDPGQISRLLSRLRRYELIQDSGVGPAKGKARAWTLTPRGESILQATGQG